MNGRSFAKDRARILRSGRPGKTQRKALAHLEREAGAQPVMRDGRLVAHRLPTGAVICTKRRYPSERAVIEEMTAIQAFLPVNAGHRVPVRYYWCKHCGGFHVTSRK